VTASGGAPATAGLVLAAGEGRRFGGPKAPYVHDGVRLVDRAVAVLRDAGCSPVLVVLGAWVGEVPDAVVVENAAWASGMGSSLRTGLAALSAYDGVDRAVVTLVDLPGLTAAAVRRVTDVAAPEPEQQLAAATYDGRRGHPVLLGSAHWEGVASTASGDQGARDYLSAHDVIGVEVSDLATGDDLDERP
jgi:nicotine blue oxidoreductase